MSVGSIADFHRGLNDRIGSPNLDFEATMRLEHCIKSGADQEIVASNYQIITTPCKEWLYVVGSENVSCACQPRVTNSTLFSFTLRS